MYRFLCIILAFISALAVSASLVVAASAQNPTASLTQAAKLLEQGQAELSIQLINRTLKTGNVPSKLAAKGIMLRAQAQEKLGKHAFALADYNSALWMQDLSENDRHFAEQGRRRIMANLGVNRRNTQTASAQPVAKPKVWGAEVRTTETEKRTKGIGSIFSNLLGLSSEEKEEPKTPPASETVYSVGTTETAALISPSSESQVVAGSSGNLVASNDQQAQAIDDTVVAQGEFTGDFAIQFSAVRSEDTALYEADRVGRRYGEWLNGRTPSIKIRGTQDGGTLYKIIAQPYERGEGLATCEFLKTKGVQCMLISR
jgi:hypothetical protein